MAPNSVLASTTTCFRKRFKLNSRKKQPIRILSSYPHRVLSSYSLRVLSSFRSVNPLRSASVSALESNGEPHGKFQTTSKANKHYDLSSEVSMCAHVAFVTYVFWPSQSIRVNKDTVLVGRSQETA